MIERLAPQINFDIDRIEDEANVMHNEISNHQNEN